MNQLQIISENMVAQMHSQNIQEVWGAYKRLSGLESMNTQQEKDILTILVANNLNPLKREAYIFGYENYQGKQYNVVIAYQTLLKRAYEEGFDSEKVEFRERKIITFMTENSQGTKFREVEDLECQATLKLSNSKTYSFSTLFSQQAQKKKNGELAKMWQEKPILMLRKCTLAGLFRTLPSHNLQALPYTREELESGIHVVINPKDVSVQEKVSSEALRKYVDRLVSLRNEERLSEEEVENWIITFNECQSLEELRERGQELRRVIQQREFESIPF